MKRLLSLILVLMLILTACNGGTTKPEQPSQPEQPGQPETPSQGEDITEGGKYAAEQVYKTV